MMLTSLLYMMCFMKVQTKPRERCTVVLSHSLNKPDLMCDTMCNIHIYDYHVIHDACHHFGPVQTSSDLELIEKSMNGLGWSCTHSWRLWS